MSSRRQFKGEPKDKKMKKHKGSKSNIDSSDEDTKEIKTVTCTSENLEDIDDKYLPKVVIEPKLTAKGKQSENIMMNFKKFKKCHSQTNSQDSPSVKLVVYNQRFEEEMERDDLSPKADDDNSDEETYKLNKRRKLSKKTKK